MNISRWGRIIASACIVLGMILVPAPASVAAQTGGEGEITRDTPYMPGELVVSFDAATPQAVTAAAQALAGEVSASVKDTFANTAVLQFDPAADVLALADEIGAQAGVTAAEPNYIFWIPEGDPKGNTVLREETTREISGKKSDWRESMSINKVLTPSQDIGASEETKQVTIPMTELEAMRKGPSAKGIPTYANDLWENWGLDWSNAGIIWSEKAASPAVCVVDTGVEAAHPDLTGNVINGKDFVNNDTIPNDDNGHGTHVAGVISAKTNNGKGIAGISNGKVVAVKVLTAQGWGTNDDIAQGILFCANNTAVKVINLSLGGPSSSAIYSALDYAINTKGKLVVAAAGNDGTSSTTYAYPAAWASGSAISDGLISVGATRLETWIDTNSNSLDDDGWYARCAANFSNYGSWVEMVAPGQDIYSTTPALAPFYDSYFYGAYSSYDSFSGTSMATPHVAAAAARLWSQHAVAPNLWNKSQIHDWLIGQGDELDTTTTGGSSGDRTNCWPTSMANATYLNVARAMNRFAWYTSVRDATNGLPLKDAVLNINLCAKTSSGNWNCGANGALKDSAKITSNFSAWVDLINLPAYELTPQGYPAIGYDEVGDPYLKYNFYNLSVQKSGFTAGVQTYLRGWGWDSGAYYSDYRSYANVPPAKGTNAVLTWDDPNYDFSLGVWLPQYSGLPTSMLRVPDLNQGYVGSLTTAPYARYNRFGGFDSGGPGDFATVESVSIVNKSGAIPYYLTPNNYYSVTTNLDGSYEDTSYPYIQVWDNGALVTLYYDGGDGWYYGAIRSKPPLGCEDLWYALDIYQWGTKIFPEMINTCGADDNTSGARPYSISGSAIFKTQ